MILHVHLLHTIEKKLKHPYNSLNLELSSDYIDFYLKNHLISLGKYKIEKIRSDLILPKYTKKFFLERGGYHQVKLIKIFEDELFTDILDDKDLLKYWIKTLNINDGDIIRLNQDDIKETYIYLQCNFLKPLFYQTNLYFGIPYEIALQIPGSAYEQYCHKDTEYGININKIYLTHKDEIWKILNLGKYDKKFKFEIKGIFSYIDQPIFLIHNCIINNGADNWNFLIENVKIKYNKIKKRVSFYCIPDNVTYKGISAYGEHDDDTYGIIRETDWVDFKRVFDQVMEKMI